MMPPEPPQDPFADEDGQFDPHAHGRLLLLAAVEAATVGPGRLLAVVRALDGSDLKAIVIAQATTLARGIEEDREARRPRRGRRRRALRAALATYRREVGR